MKRRSFSYRRKFFPLRVDHMMEGLDHLGNRKSQKLLSIVKTTENMEQCLLNWFTKAMLFHFNFCVYNI